MATYNLQSHDSVRHVVINSVRDDARVDEGIRNSFVEWSGIKIALLPEAVDLDGWNPSTQPLRPIEWVIWDQSGLIRASGDYADPVLSYVTPRQVAELVELGYADGNPKEIVVTVVWGRGGGGEPVYDIVNWLLGQGVDLGWQLPRDAVITWLLGKFFKGVRNGARDRRARKIAARWAEHAGLRYPMQLRKFFDRKRSWPKGEVTRRLQVPDVVAMQLLKALGFVEDATGEWVPGTNKKAQARRRRWVDGESSAAVWDGY